MNAYEQILDTMRQQGGKDNTPPIQLGIMDSPTSCSIGKLKLSGEDLLAVEQLKTGYHKAVNNLTPSQKDDSTYVKPLAKGDKIALYRMNDELYIILGRLVNL